MQNLVIKEVSKKEWQSLSPQATFSVFQHPDWLESLSTKKTAPIYLEFKQDHKTIAFASGLVKETIIGSYLYFYSGINECSINDTTHLLNECYKELLKYAKRKKYYRVISGCYDSQTSFCSYPNEFYTFNRKEFLINTPSHLPTRDYSKQIKTNLKRALKAEIEFETSTDARHIDSLKQLLKETQTRRVSKKTERYNPLYLVHTSFKSLENCLNSGLAKLYIFKDNQSINTIIYTLETHNKAYILLVGNRLSSLNSGISTYAYDQIIKQHKSQGIITLNLGGTTLKSGGEGLTRYKLGLGCHEIELTGATTNFLIWPYKALNPFLKLARIANSLFK
jgi:lipid II:glycine glycyltransferase (peptidoglycan interpeptide bridge formation enzyme)